MLPCNDVFWKNIHFFIASRQRSCRVSGRDAGVSKPPLANPANAYPANIHAANADSANANSANARPLMVDSDAAATALLAQRIALRAPARVGPLVVGHPSRTTASSCPTPTPARAGPLVAGHPSRTTASSCPTLTPARAGPLVVGHHHDGCFSYVEHCFHKSILDNRLYQSHDP
jgi:hypothetical protein